MGQPTATPTDRAEVLAAWLAPRLGAERVAVSGLGRSDAGNSNETVIFTASWEAEGRAQTQRLVVRIQPGSDSLFLRPSVVREAAVVQAVERASDVPVPHVVGIEPDPAVLGAPFFLMSHIEGRVLNDVPSYHRRGWLVDLPPAERAKHWDEGLKAVVAVAGIPATEVPFLESGAEGTPLQRLLQATRESFDWAADGRDVGLLGQAMDYLAENLSAREDGVLSWGDARPGNMLYRLDGTVAAVLDWEMAAIAPAELDLAWWLFMDEIYSVKGGYARLEGIPDDDALVARWEQLIGRPAQDLRWFQVLAGVRMGLVMLRSRDQQVSRGLLPPTATTHLYNPVTQLLATYLDAPVPEMSPDFATLMRALHDEKVGREKSAEATSPAIVLP
jgi:aminoglycoside phosphotransferase (APT) family kinase protein